MAVPFPPQFEKISTGSTITAIQPVANDPNLRRIAVNGRTVARLRAADVERLAIAPGQTWTKRVAADIAEALAADKARRAAMSILSRRGYSRGELLERLVRRRHDKRLAVRIVDELTEDGWLNDLEYARTVAQLLLQRKGASERLVIETLRKRHIDDEIAASLAKEAFGGVDEVEAAARIIEPRLRAMKGQSKRSSSRRLAGLLARRGYDEETILAALARVGFSPEDDAA